MIIATEEIKAQEGPYFDFSARGKYLSQEAGIAARICTQKLLDGHDIEARYWAEQYRSFRAESTALWEWYETRRDDPHRWVGYHGHL